MQQPAHGEGIGESEKSAANGFKRTKPLTEWFVARDRLKAASMANSPQERPPAVASKISAKAVVIMGAVTGDVSASERVEIQASGSVDGDITTPRLMIAAKEASSEGESR